MPDFFEGIKDSTNEVLHMFTKYIFRLSNQPILHSWYNFQHSARLICWIQNNANQLHICLCTQTWRQLHSQSLVSLSAKNHAWILALWHKFEESDLLHQLRLEHTSYSQINKTYLLSIWHLLHNFSTEDVDLPWHGKAQIWNSQTKPTHQEHRMERNSKKWTPHYLRPVRQPDTANFRSNTRILQSNFPHMDEPLLPAHIPRDSHFQQQFNSVTIIGATWLLNGM